MSRPGPDVRILTDPAEHREAEQLLSQVWRSERGSPVTAELMRAFAHAGGYVAGAFVDGELVGVAAGFLSRSPSDDAPPELHSHITGVAPHVQGRRVGFALKLHQREWALAHGIETIKWTFDPLVRRNAYFNLARLGARVDAYLVDFYGDMADGINAGQGSDRLLVRWQLRADDVAAAAAGRLAEPDLPGVVLLEADDRGGPLPHSPPPAGTLLCWVPPDIEELRRRDPTLARDWRREVRTAFTTTLADGGHVVGIRRPGWYVIATNGTSPGPTTDSESA